jgi:hypothetical protein
MESSKHKASSGVCKYLPQILFLPEQGHDRRGPSFLFPSSLWTTNPMVGFLWLLRPHISVISWIPPLSRIRFFPQSSSRKKLKKERYSRIQNYVLFASCWPLSRLLSDLNSAYSCGSSFTFKEVVSFISEKAKLVKYTWSVQNVTELEVERQRSNTGDSWQWRCVAVALGFSLTPARSRHIT